MKIEFTSTDRVSAFLPFAKEHRLYVPFQLREMPGIDKQIEAFKDILYDYNYLKACRRYGGRALRNYAEMCFLETFEKHKDIQFHSAFIKGFPSIFNLHYKLTNAIPDDTDNDV